MDPASEALIHHPDPEPMTPRLTLVGTLHGAARGEAELVSLLERLRPGQLTMEISPEAVAYREQHGLLLLRKLEMILDRLAITMALPRAELGAHPDILAIRKLLGLPYELRAARSYARQHGIALNCIDHAELSLSKLRKVEEDLITFAHLKQIVSRTPRAAVSRRQGPELARQLLADPPVSQRRTFLESCRGVEGIGPRDRHLAEQIRALSAAHPGHLVHIGGWVHLVDDPLGETLFSRLGDLHPQRVLLEPDHPAAP